MEEDEEESGASRDEEVGEVYWSHVSENLLLVIVCLSICPFVQWGLFLLHLHVVGPGTGLWYLTYAKICFILSLTTKRADEIFLGGGWKFQAIFQFFFYYMSMQNCWPIFQLLSRFLLEKRPKIVKFQDFGSDGLQKSVNWHPNNALRVMKLFLGINNSP